MITTGGQLTFSKDMSCQLSTVSFRGEKSLVVAQGYMVDPI